MKLRMLVHALEKALCALRGEDENPADMFLPEKLLSLSLVFFAASAAFLVFAVLKNSSVVLYLASAAALLFGAASFLCWRNQKICMLNEDVFTYTTMFGRTREYRFDEIVALKKNRDSFTLIMKDGQIHMESMAILSDRLIKRIDAEFK